MTNPMTCDQFADHLADYLEGDMDPMTRVPMETHASSCAECGLLLADLQKLHVEATNLPELSPGRDLWAGIAARIQTPVVELKNGGTGGTGTVERWNGGTQPRTNRIWIGLAAAGLIVATATITHEVTKRSITAASPAQTASVQPATRDTEVRSAPATQVAKTNVDTVAPAKSAVPPSTKAPTTRLASSKPSAEQTYEKEIARLRAVLNYRRPHLDSSTVAVVEHNLQVIDEAIAQCKRALRVDPASRFLMESLNDAFDTKVQLLRTAATLPSTT
jgi:hypothetical protein